MRADLADGFCNYYERASIAAVRALPRVRELGFFSGTHERIETFMEVCRYLDVCVGEKVIEKDEALVALFILMFSSNNFKKAIKAFTNFAHGKNLDPRHLDSFTACLYAQTC